MLRHKYHGIKKFLSKNYDDAILHFSLALQDKIEDRELQTYLNLAYFAKENEDEATALFDFYSACLKSKNFKSKEEIERTVDALQTGFEKLSSIQEQMDLFLMEENGISYEDFLYLVEERGSFAKAFEDIMFSTRVLISKKEDFLHFLNLLVDNGFKQMALNYLESATALFPAELSLQDLANKVNK